MPPDFASSFTLFPSVKEKYELNFILRKWLFKTLLQFRDNLHQLRSRSRKKIISHTPSTTELKMNLEHHTRDCLQEGLKVSLGHLI